MIFSICQRRLPKSAVVKEFVYRVLLQTNLVSACAKTWGQLFMLSTSQNQIVK